jgi:hypothetical protein
MNPLDLITSAITGIVSPVTTAITRHQEIAAAQHDADLKAVQAQGDRQADLIKQGLAADANWELESLKAGQGWARNFELYVISIPAILCFTPYAYIVKAGFDALSQTPGWFQTAFLTIYLANYGIRLWRRQQSDT